MIGGALAWNGTAALVCLSFLSFIFYSVFTPLLDPLRNFVSSLFVRSIAIPSSNKYYTWVVDWIAKKRKDVGHSHWQLADTIPRWTLACDIPLWVTFEGHWLFVVRAHQTFYPYDHTFLKISCVNGPQSQAILKRFLDEARRVSTDQRSKKRTNVYMIIRGVRTLWTCIRNRSLSSVILSEKNQFIIEDIRRFLHPDNRKWYIERGIPYSRSYLLHGAPGTGKTSLVKAVAATHGYSIVVISLADPELTDSILCREANRSDQILLLFEDIDRILPRDNSKQQVGKGKVTFSGLLNALDGIGEADGRLVFFTTNHVEILDSEALTRAGRVDVKVNLDLADEYMIRMLFRTFFKSAPAELAIEFARAVPSSTFSMAELQEYLVHFIGCPRDAVRPENLSRLPTNRV